MREAKCVICHPQARALACPTRRAPVKTMPRGSAVVVRVVLVPLLPLARRETTTRRQFGVHAHRGRDHVHDERVGGRNGRPSELVPAVAGELVEQRAAVLVRDTTATRHDEVLGPDQRAQSVSLRGCRAALAENASYLYFRLYFHRAQNTGSGTRRNPATFPAHSGDIIAVAEHEMSQFSASPRSRLCPTPKSPPRVAAFGL